MKNLSTVDQNEVDAVWSAVWEDSSDKAYLHEFSNRLFIEGYRVMKPLVPPDAKTIIETGTGSGRYAAAFARDFPQARVLATDIVPESLEAARALKNHLNLGNLAVESADVQSLAYPDSSFDVVLSDALIQHVPDDGRAVSEMIRILRPGGTLIIAAVNRMSPHAFVRLVQRMFGRPYRYGMERLYTRRSLRALVENAGGKVISETGFYPAYGIYRLKRFWSGFGFLGKIFNRISHFLDTITGTRISKYFGFEIVVVAAK